MNIQLQYVERTLVYQVRDSYSQKNCMNIGIPQGSVLGSLLLILFVNGMPDFLNVCVCVL